MPLPLPTDVIGRAFNKFKPAIGRLYRRADHKPLNGTCFLVAPDCAVTCHHVVPDGAAELDIVFEGLLKDFIPVLAVDSLGAGIDLAVLRLSRAVLLLSFPLSSSEPWGCPFATFGYPVAHGGGGTTTFGEILGPTTVIRGQMPFRRFEMRTEADQITPGFSGAPVFVLSPKAECFVTGCVSETGSPAYPGAPSCTPFSEAQSVFRANPRVVVVVESVSETFDSLSQDSPQDEAARWKLTKQIVDPHRIVQTENLDEIARQTFDAVSQTMARATVEDDAKTVRLAVIVSGLRAKYQRLQFDLQELISVADEGQRKRTLEEDRLQQLIQKASIVVGDFRRIDADLLAFAKTHGAEIHGRVLDGFCFSLVSQLADSPLRRAAIGAYDFENLGRLFRSFRSLLQFDLEALSHGFSVPGWVKPVPPDTQRLIVAGINGTEPYVCALAESKEGKCQEIGRLTARKTKLFDVRACIEETSHISIVGGSFEHVYRWRLSSPTPYTDIAVRTQHAYGVADLFYLDEAGADIVAQTYDGEFLAVKERSVERLGRANDFMPEIICWRQPGADRLQIIQSSNALPRSFIRYEIADSVDLKQRTYLSEIVDEQFSYLFDDLDEWPHGKAGSLHHMSVQKYLGAPCLLSVTSLSPQGSAVLFLNPMSLEPIRTPVIMNDRAVVPQIASFRGSTFLVVTLLEDMDNRHALGAWNITDPTERSAPRLLNKWHEGHGDATRLAVVNRAEGFDAYFSTEPLVAGPKNELWKFSWETQEVTPIRIAHEGLLSYLSVVSLPSKFLVK